jgi:hypothetical protein
MILCTLDLSIPQRDACCLEASKLFAHSSRQIQPEIL